MITSGHAQPKARRQAPKAQRARSLLQQRWWFRGGKFCVYFCRMHIMQLTSALRGAAPLPFGVSCCKGCLPCPYARFGVISTPQAVTGNHAYPERSTDLCIRSIGRVRRGACSGNGTRSKMGVIGKASWAARARQECMGREDNGGRPERTWI